MFVANQTVTLTKTNIINDRKFIGKKAIVDFPCKDGMVWIKIGRSSRCVHQDNLKAI